MGQPTAHEHQRDGKRGASRTVLPRRQRTRVRVPAGQGLGAGASRRDTPAARPHCNRRGCGRTRMSGSVLCGLHVQQRADNAIVLWNGGPILSEHEGFSSLMNAAMIWVQ